MPQDFGFRVELGLSMISGSGLRVSDLGRMVHGLGFGSLGSGFRIFGCSSGLRLWA